ncbi:concanavalin A-like lectin/glucanase domain-containing protein [Colletotrichum navitas]|uniref:Concanavalin A-like lectin/glucanase domain-containing protein n=1 Tax=Colletotrichum navitas TaxID=681940 RepID=A0AAD8V6V6_9PEZI|nr:concanavalin A-like lectin/glucanase domain-containing protein [Colletotrichum navitas]KAK1595219.1 concanavalin A-like lectin/glucanase domain-containing protein [Colletotrichum navitas]
MRSFGKACLLAVPLLPDVTRAACECGYSANITGTVEVFTDLIETDFTKVMDIENDADWIRQEFNKTNTNARGPLGEDFQPANIAAVHEGSSSYGFSSTKADAGLQLLVRSSTVNGMVPGAEIDSAREDVKYGSFRAMIKVPSIAGTCAAFFWYHNDTQEIDMEFLTREFNPSNNSFPVNLVLQSRASLEKGYVASSTGNFLKVNLGFNPATDFHEYRIDYLRDNVTFYADGKVLAAMNGSAVPTEGGHLILQHWSNGNPLWSGGPPKTDAIMTVASVKAYFNSSLDARKADHDSRCIDPAAPGAVCAIPDNPAFFFSTQANMTNNQTVSGTSSTEHSGSRMADPPSWMLVPALLFLGVWFV